MKERTTFNRIGGVHFLRHPTPWPSPTEFWVSLGSVWVQASCLLWVRCERANADGSVPRPLL